MNINFIKSAVKYQDYPELNHPEVAFCGRSNVGKSSLINKILGRKNLVKVSSTPGKTKLINFFEIMNKYIFTDLPGYGYAKVSKTEKATWDGMISTYFQKRENLRVAAVLLDSRRTPSLEDMAMINMLYLYEIQPLFIITKSDKLSNNTMFKQKKIISETLQVKASTLICVSVLKNKGMEEVWNALETYLN